MRIDVWLASVTVGQPGHRPPLVRGAHLDQPGDVRRLAGGRHRVQHVGVHAVEQEPDDVARTPGGGVEHVVAHHAVLTGEVVAVVVAARSRGARRRWARRRRGARPAARARRCARPCPRSRTAPVPARSRAIRARRDGRPGPPSCARRCGARTGRARRDGRTAARCGRSANGYELVARDGYGSAISAVRPTSRVGRLVGDRVLPAAAGALVAVGPGADTPELDVAVGARRLVRVAPRAARHHVDDR